MRDAGSPLNNRARATLPLRGVVLAAAAVACSPAFAADAEPAVGAGAASQPPASAARRTDPAQRSMRETAQAAADEAQLAARLARAMAAPVSRWLVEGIRRAARKAADAARRLHEQALLATHGADDEIRQSVLALREESSRAAAATREALA